MANRSIFFTDQLVHLLLVQSGVIRSDEELIADPKLPAKVGDIFRSKKYWNQKIKNKSDNEQNI
ncbi:MAG: hypothetical protein PHN66_02120 [Candidatus Shapirobacteria bacterium]|jgi:hypothetical protein|nr:hypothetical protein [Candidatus Shapirobacteria bacterium]